MMSFVAFIVAFSVWAYGVTWLLGAFWARQMRRAWWR